MPKIERALLSVYDKSELIPFGEVLAAAGAELISTGRTANAMRAGGLKVTDLSAYTGFPEMLGGSVKTLHPRIHGGLLYLRGDPQHEAAAKQYGIQPIDVVVVNLYPFEQTVAKPGVTLEEAIENIDIGGPAMLRSAAKNHESVTVVIDPADYPVVASQIKQHGNTTRELRRQLAARVFARTSAYDASIAEHLCRAFGISGQNPLTAAMNAATSEGLLPPSLTIDAPLVQPLRYGENPHQKAALYGRFHDFFEQLHGKQLSDNNILDLTAPAGLIGDFSGDRPTLAILKHMTPCGVRQGENLRAAWDKPLTTDRQAPFGGVIAVNQPLDLPC